MKDKEIKLNSTTQIVSFCKGAFTFSNGKILTLIDEHEQDCCENVYADWSTLPLQQDQFMNKDIDSIEIKGVEELGFLIIFKNKDNVVDKAMINCHNEQNGYYSNELKLIIKYNGKETTADISDFVKDNID